MDLDYSILSDDQLVTLIRGALVEAVRRGGAVEAAVRAAGLEEAEKARIAAEAADREARKIREAEERRIAEEAASKVRREAEAAKGREAAAAAEELNREQREVAAESRTLFGHDVDSYEIHVWQKPGDKRVYVGGGYGNNWCCYYHTGTARTQPGTVELYDGGKVAVRQLAAHLGVSADEAKARIKSFLERVATRWANLKLDVTDGNAPRDRAARVVRYAVKASDGYFVTEAHRGTTKASEARTFATREEAAAAIPGLAESLPNFFGEKFSPAVVEVASWLAFPPKGGA